MAVTVAGAKEILEKQIVEEVADEYPGKKRLRRVKEDTLAWIQEWAPEADEILPGVPGLSGHCPIAETLNSNTDNGQQWRINSNYAMVIRMVGWAKIDLPKSVMRFVSYFDNNKYPELIR